VLDAANAKFVSRRSDYSRDLITFGKNAFNTNNDIDMNLFLAPKHSILVQVLCGTSTCMYTLESYTVNSNAVENVELRHEIEMAVVGSELST